MAIARLIPVSMIARALDPGCQYRYVVILCGDEVAGKSKLVRSLASPEWYREISTSLEGKESHVLVQGAWVAELGELESLSRTGEARLKSFITMQQDAYVPKYKMATVSVPRRTIFIGTTNEETFLRGTTGNTRFLPIKTGEVDPEGFVSQREQILAQALDYYRAHPEDWWQISAEAEAEAITARDAAREVNVYEKALGEWLADLVNVRIPIPGTLETTWPEIAAGFLKLEDKDKWANKGLQMQIAQALTVLGWKSVSTSETTNGAP
jgi:putative DNA primase/helicase